MNGIEIKEKSFIAWLNEHLSYALKKSYQDAGITLKVTEDKVYLKRNGWVFKSWPDEKVKSIVHLTIQEIYDACEEEYVKSLEWLKPGIEFVEVK